MSASFFNSIVNGIPCVQCGMILKNISILEHKKNECKENMNRKVQQMNSFFEKIQPQTNSITLTGLKSTLRTVRENYEKKIQEKELQIILQLREKMLKKEQELKLKKQLEQSLKEHLLKPEVCSVCHDDLVNDIDTPCENGHFFHCACLKQIKKHKQKKCPICRCDITKYLESLQEIEKD